MSRGIDGLALAASPVFAVMALLTGGAGGDAAGMAMHASPLGGMATMYLLMGLVHLSPWLRLASGSPPARG